MKSKLGKLLRSSALQSLQPWLSLKAVDLDKALTDSGLFVPSVVAAAIGNVMVDVDFTALCTSSAVFDEWSDPAVALAAFGISGRAGAVFQEAMTLASDQTGPSCGLGVGCRLHLEPLSSGNFALKSSSGAGTAVTMDSATLW